jgi:cardiolipin synthase C
MNRALASLVLLLSLAVAAGAAPPVSPLPADPRAFIDAQLQAHPGQTGSYVLDRGEQALLARAWLVDHARHSVEVQYFIWSTDNIGILASEALLRAAARGVKVRVIVDDLLMDAPDKTLLALAHHPNIDIRIYNPVHSVGVPWYRRLLHLLTNFRGANQRMHDKTLVVDGKLAITGGRNMADEYFDFDHAYNFRDRDALVIGAVVPQIRASFERFWGSSLSLPVEKLYSATALMRKHVTVADAEVQRVYAVPSMPYRRISRHWLPRCGGGRWISSATCRARMTAAPALAVAVSARPHWRRCCRAHSARC